MYISSVSLRNFRNFKKANFKFINGVNTIIGENGSGKSNFFYAIRILLDNSLPRFIKFTDTDFNRAIGPWLGHWIIISIVFDGLDTSEEAQALALQTTAHMDKTNSGSYSVFFRPKQQFRKEFFDYSQRKDKNQHDFQLLLSKLTIDDYETVYLSRGTGDFSDDVVYKKYIGDFDNIIFPDPDNKEELIFGTWLPKEINIHNEVSCTFIKALRDVESDLRSYSNNPLVNLLRGKEKTVEVAKKDEIIASINTLNKDIGNLKEVDDVKKGIIKTIIQAVGTTYAPTIEIKSELPNDMEKLLQSLKLWVGDPDDNDYKGRIWELSLGGANLIYLSLKLLEYEQVKSDKIANFLLVEEPEAHVHNHIQKTLFSNLSLNKTQVIISTHSTHISSVSLISRVNILSRDKSEALVFQPSNKLNPNHILRIERYLDAVRSNLLFAKGIVLVEGDAEQILIPNLFKHIFGLSLDEIGVSLVNIGSTGFENIARIFHEQRIMKNCAILTDADKSIISLPTDPLNDNKYQKKCRASEKSGKERRDNLNKFSSGNKFIHPFYAEYTFEVDFLMLDNSYEIIQCLPSIYKKENNITASTTKLKDKNVSIAGNEILRLAKKYGKGWLAILLSEKITYATSMPEYIIEAIAFASKHIDLPSKTKAVHYRLNSIRNNEKDELQDVAKKFITSGKKEQEIVDEFCKTFTEDQLSIFLQLI